jgi:hypothetical protein
MAHLIACCTCFFDISGTVWFIAIYIDMPCGAETLWNFGFAASDLSWSARRLRAMSMSPPAAPEAVSRDPPCDAAPRGARPAAWRHVGWHPE